MGNAIPLNDRGHMCATSPSDCIDIAQAFRYIHLAIARDAVLYGGPSMFMSPWHIPGCFVLCWHPPPLRYFPSTAPIRNQDLIWWGEFRTNGDGLCGIRAPMVGVYDLWGSSGVTFSANGGSGGDGRGLASGMYICRMPAGGFTASRSMLLLRWARRIQSSDGACTSVASQVERTRSAGIWSRRS